MYRKFCIGFLFCLYLGGCSPCYNLRDPLCIRVPDDFQPHPEGKKQEGCWWEEFQQPELNRLVAETLCHNFDLMQAWDRLDQAREDIKIVNSGRLPQVNLNASVTQFKRYGFDTPPLSGDGGFIPMTSFGGTNTFYSVGADLSYEIDVWRRIGAKVQSSCQEFWARENDIRSTALLLSGTVTDLWLTIQEQRALLDLFKHQIEVNKTQLELLELRFSVGESLALDVFQQRLQVASTESQVPPIRSRLKTANQQLATLLGEAPKAIVSEDPAPLKVALPAFPELGRPQNLLWYRPDLRASYRRLFAAERDIAYAMRDRFPKFLFELSYNFQAEDIKRVFEQEILTLIGQIVMPIIDGGRRKAEVVKRKAIFQERLHGLSQNMLVALLEVENAITEEKEQKRLLEQLELQKKIADQNLSESQFHYMNGLNDYLTVIAAIQALQNVERRIISETKQLLSIRARLYRALGGCPVDY